MLPRVAHQITVLTHVTGVLTRARTSYFRCLHAAAVFAGLWGAAAVLASRSSGLALPVCGTSSFRARPPLGGGGGRRYSHDSEAGSPHPCTISPGLVCLLTGSQPTVMGHSTVGIWPEKYVPGRFSCTVAEGCCPEEEGDCAGVALQGISKAEWVCWDFILPCGQWYDDGTPSVGLQSAGLALGVALRVAPAVSCALSLGFGI